MSPGQFNSRYQTVNTKSQDSSAVYSFEYSAFLFSESRERGRPLFEADSLRGSSKAVLEGVRLRGVADMVVGSPLQGVVDAACDFLTEMPLEFVKSCTLFVKSCLHSVGTSNILLRSSCLLLPHSPYSSAPLPIALDRLTNVKLKNATDACNRRVASTFSTF